MIPTTLENDMVNEVTEKVHDLRLNRFVSFSSREILTENYGSSKNCQSDDTNDSSAVDEQNGSYDGHNEKEISMRTNNYVSSEIKAKTNYLKSFCFVFMCIVMILCAFLSFQVMNSHKILDYDIDNDYSIYVPGYGFSGFWYTLGRIQSLKNPESYDYYCYSAGCLAPVARFKNWSLEEVIHFAVGARDKWKGGNIDRYSVVDHFVSGLLDTDENNKTCQFNSTVEAYQCQSHVKKMMLSSPSWLSNLNILTTTKDRGIVTHKVQKPKNIYELHQMLIQTTWM